MKKTAFILALSFLTTPLLAQEFTSRLSEKIALLNRQFDLIEDSRKSELNSIAEYISGKNETAKLLFICTHNSRRSQMAQIWLSTAAAYYGLDNTIAFSGGTEATRFHPNAIAALKRAGFVINVSPKGDNPSVSVKAGKNLTPWLLFSKKFSDSQNPHKHFMAVMVCSDADKSCPIVEGAEKRIALPYDDPRYFDDTPAQDQEYDKTSDKIALEMFYIMKQVKRKAIIAKESLR